MSALKNPIRGFAYLTFVLLAGVATQAQPGPSAANWNLLHPDAKLLVGIDVKALRESATGKFVGSQMAEQLTLQSGAAGMFAPMVAQALNDIDYLMISTNGAMANKSAVSSSDFLLVMEGRFANSPLSFFMSGTPQDYKGAKVYGVPGKTTGQPSSFALVNANLLVVGDTRSLHAALDRQAAITLPMASPNSLRARATELAQTHDFWLAALDLVGLPFGKISPSGTPAIDGFEIAMGLHDGLAFELNVLAQSEAMAQMMSQMVSSQLASAVSSSQIDNAQARELATRLQVNAEGKRVHLSLHLTQDEVEHQLRAAQSNRALADAINRNQPQPELRAAAKPEPRDAKPEPRDAKPESRIEVVREQPKPAPSRKIRIVGLDEGPREIDLK